VVLNSLIAGQWFGATVGPNLEVRMAEYPNPDRLAGLMQAFDTAVSCKAQAHSTREQLAKTAKEELEVARSNDGPGELIVYVPHQKNRRPLNPFSMFRYIRDNIRLRKYNDEWIKNNLR
jgi:hypothetical protein